MKILIIQHSAADRPAVVSEVIARLGHVVQTIRLDRQEAIPTSVEADVLMMFGGAISLTARDLPLWVAQEQALIRDYVNQGQRVFGICLGSQMLAAALGAEVRRNPHPEIGWHEVERVGDSPPSKLTEVFPDRWKVLQWHQDTFTIPPGAKRIFQSQACENQAFVIDDRVFGFQFHMEADPKTVMTFLAVSDKWKQAGPFVQSETAITEGIEEHLPAQAETLRRFLEIFLDG